MSTPQNPHDEIAAALGAQAPDPHSEIAAALAPQAEISGALKGPA